MAVHLYEVQLARAYDTECWHPFKVCLSFSNQKSASKSIPTHKQALQPISQSGLGLAFYLCIVSHKGTGVLHSYDVQHLVQGPTHAVSTREGGQDLGGLYKRAGDGCFTLLCLRLHPSHLNCAGGRWCLYMNFGQTHHKLAMDYSRIWVDPRWPNIFIAFNWLFMRIFQPTPNLVFSFRQMVTSLYIKYRCDKLGSLKSWKFLGECFGLGKRGHPTTQFL